MTITSCKPLAVSHGENIYGYGKTEEVGKVAFIWPKQIKFPSSKLRALDGRNSLLLQNIDPLISVNITNR